VDCAFETVTSLRRAGVQCEDDKRLEEFRARPSISRARHAGDWSTRADRVNLSLTIERWPDIEFGATREH